jgi:hypothetical protein
MLPRIATSLEDLLRTLRASDRDPLRWAKRIVADPRAYPFISVKFADEALRRAEPPPREPGEDVEVSAPSEPSIEEEKPEAPPW